MVHEVKKLIESMLHILHVSQLKDHQITPHNLVPYRINEDYFFYDGCIGLLLNLHNLIIPNNRLTAIQHQQPQVVNDTYSNSTIQSYPNIYSQTSENQNNDDDIHHVTHKRHLSSSCCDEVVNGERHYFNNKDLKRVNLMHDNIQLRLNIINSMEINEDEKIQHKKDLYNEAHKVFLKLNNL